MSEAEANAAAAEASNTEAVENEAEGNEESGEGATQEEISAALKSAGMKLPEEPAVEEGDDDNTADDSAAGTTGDEPEDDEEAEVEEIEKPEQPEDKTVESDTPQFTLEVEDATGVTHKIEKIEDLPEDFEPKNNRQIMEIISNLAKLETEKTQHETNQAAEAKAADDAKAVEDIQAGWKEERKELNVTDDARFDEIMEHMSKENDKRQEENKPLIRTLEHALLSLEKVEAKEEADKKAKSDKESARKNGALVGGSSAPATSSGPEYRAGSARNANEAIRKMGLIS